MLISTQSQASRTPVRQSSGPKLPQSRPADSGDRVTLSAGLDDVPLVAGVGALALVPGLGAFVNATASVGSLFTNHDSSASIAFGVGAVANLLGTGTLIGGAIGGSGFALGTGAALLAISGGAAAYGMARAV